MEVDTDSALDPPAGVGVDASTVSGVDPQLIVPRFQTPLDDDKVELVHVLEANIWRSRTLTDDAQQRAAGDHYYPKLRAAFLEKHPGAEIVVQEAAGLAVMLGAGEEEELEIVIIRHTIRFDWTAPRKSLVEINELAQEAKRWVPSPERRGLQLTLLGVASQLFTAIGRENTRCPAGQGESTPPSEHLATDLNVIEPQIATTRQSFLQDAQRAAQLKYAKGMAVGAVVLGAVCALLGVGFALVEVQAVNGVAILAGGVGACLSVLQRMTSDDLKLNYQAGDKMLVAFGAVRPFVGAVFGMVTFCVLKAKLISALIVPQGVNEQLAFVTVFAFVAGFNERFFQDMLANASKGLGEEGSAGTSRSARQA